MIKLRSRIFLVLCGFIAINVHAQELKQTIRGRVTDIDTKIPLIGANIIVLNTDPIIGTTADNNGDFILEKVPVGRYNIQVTYIGYIQQTIYNQLIGSGKEIYLNLELQESSIKVDEVVIKAYKDKSKPLNTMASISARSFSVEETRRYAGGLDDPQRMVTAFAGVAANGIEDNSIVIRGNNPKGVLWRLEGVQIPNPNHWADENYVGGGVFSILSAQLLSNSDFYTGAFPAEYGNALSGVFDMKLRNGNRDKREYTMQAGLMGIEAAMEGPFVKGKNASYLINYRYSTFGLLGDLGVIDKSVSDMRYQDLSFKINMPTRKLGIFSIWGIGGVDKYFRAEVKDPVDWEKNWDLVKSEIDLSMGAAGLSHNIILGEKTYLKSSIAATMNSIVFETHRLDSVNNNLTLNPYVYRKSIKGQYTFTSYLNHKFSAKHVNRTGIIFTNMFYDVNLKTRPEITSTDISE